jgi:protein-disulfide isomerase
LTIVRASLLSLLLFTAAGCSAQSGQTGGTPDGPKAAPAASAQPKPGAAAPSESVGGAPDPELARRIESYLRERYQRIPNYAKFTFGQRKASEVPGFDTMAIVLSAPEGSTSLDFYISPDNKKMGRFDSFELPVLLDTAKKIDVNGRAVRGNPNAKVSVIVYDDFQCPFCAMMHDQVVKNVLPHYGEKVKVVYKDYPLTQIHPWATPAAVNANCIAAQNGNAYWEYTDKVHAEMDKINKNDKGEKRPLVEQTNRLAGMATDIGAKHGLDAQRLDACIKAQDDSAVKKSHDEGDSLGVDSTPTLFINGERIAGAAPMEDLRAVLDRALVAAGETPPPPPPAPKDEAKLTKPAASKPNSGAPSPKPNEKK